MFDLLFRTLDGGVPVAMAALTRAACDSCCGLALGNLLLAWYVIPPSLAADQPRVASARHSLECWTLVALMAAIMASLCWWPWVSQQMSGAASFTELRPLLWVVLDQTTFGGMLKFYWLLMLLGMLLLVLCRCRWTRPVSKELRGGALVVIAMLTLLKPLAGHGESVPSGYLLPMALHVLAASVWLGCLPGLIILCRQLKPQAGVILKRFSWLGILCVVTLALAGMVQTIGLVGSWQGLFESRYGVLIVAKALLLGGMLVLALVNRLYWTSRATTGGKGLALTMAVEWVIGLAVFVAAALLAAQSPPGLMAGMQH